MINNNPKSPIKIQSFGAINALGSGCNEILASLKQGRSSGMQSYQNELLDKPFYCGVVDAELPRVPKQLAKFDCRNNQLILAALSEIEQSIEQAKKRFQSSRIGVVMGTSTSGIKEAEIALKFKSQNQVLPDAFDYKMQEIGALAEFVKTYLELAGPSYAISTACSSSGKVFASAARLLRLGICDAVIVGGSDSLCDLTLGGFESLEAISSQPTNPFSVNRAGINIGEGAAVFLLTKADENLSLNEIGGNSSQINSDNQLLLLGVGESSDAHHMSAPEPNGAGAIACMQAALEDAGLSPEYIDYLNLHGTGTKLNDSMEAKAVNKVFGPQLPCSSTKPMTGHTLGAAGATEVAICCLILAYSNHKIAPIHRFDGQLDSQLSEISLVESVNFKQPIRAAMSNSFAFGGNNVSVIIGKG
jgi:3-oxoacyl-[acyl-carrier-protein] synthase I